MRQLNYLYKKKKRSRGRSIPHIHPVNTPLYDRYHRLNRLALLNIHPEIIIKPEEVVDAYANKHPRRLQLL
jgi:signal recognition particle subunit SEC65